MNGKIKTIIIIVVGLVAIGSVFLFSYLKSVNDYQSAVENISVADIDISKIADGVYTGECNVDYIYAKVAVSVKAGKITNIELIEHKNDRGKPAEAITDKIIEEQMIDVDTVTGATNSSKVIKKAVENALS